MKKKLLDDRKFYKSVITLVIPIMLQNGITNFVSLLDNIMVGRIGTEQMSGVSIVNQLIFVFNLFIFGGISGASIFGAQFYGQKNFKGLRDTFRFKIATCILILLCGIGVFTYAGRNLILLYLHESASGGNLTATLSYAERYMAIMLIGLVPFIIEQCYASTLRETGQTLVPMNAGIVAVFVNLVLNYILIFGKFGFPALGVAGAAYATVISRFVEAGIILTWTHMHAERNQFIIGAYRNIAIPPRLAKKIIIMGVPLLINEGLWASGVAAQTQCYSFRGLSVIAGLNISSTISNVFSIVFIALGSAISIIVGQLLGAGKLKEAKETASKIIKFSVLCCILLGILMAGTSTLFPKIYNTSEDVRYLAGWFIGITALLMPLQAFLNATYFTIRSGGKTLITFLFDSVFLWTIAVPAAFILTHYTDLHILLVFLLCQLLDIIKATVGFIIMKSGIWIKNIVCEEKEPEKVDVLL